MKYNISIWEWIVNFCYSLLNKKYLNSFIYFQFNFYFSLIMQYKLFLYFYYIFNSLKLYQKSVMVGKIKTENYYNEIRWYNMIWMYNVSWKCHMQRGFNHGVIASAALCTRNQPNPKYFFFILIILYIDISWMDKKRQNIFCLLA